SPGQQVTTNPAMEPVPLEAQISWSRSVASYLALLQRSISPAVRATAAALPSARPTRFAAAPQNTQILDSLLIIGAGAGAGAAGGRGQRQLLGNGRPAPAANDPGRGFNSTSEAEQTMQQALTSRETATDLSVLAETDYFQLNRAEYFVPVTL